MIPVLTKKQAYKLDEDTMKSGYLTQEELMNNAGKAVAQFFCEKIDNPFNQKVVVVCGKGNNGGDGVITHSYLKYYGVCSEIVFTEAKHNHTKLLKKYKISKNEYSIYNNKTMFDKYDWIIDGIFGIGLSRKLNKKYIKIIDKMNYKDQILSIDIPSGLSSDSDKYKHAINSKYIITFDCPKLGHYLNVTNNLNIVNIGLKDVSSDNIELIAYQDIETLIISKRVKERIHKYKKGKALVFAGSDKYPGAGILSAKAAKLTGSGYVELYLQSENKNLISQIDLILPEIIVSDNTILKAIVDPGCNSILFGPGYMDDLNSYTFLEDLKFNKINIDNNVSYVFDGFQIFENYLENLYGLEDFNNDYYFDEYPEYSILTPHTGELARIFDEFSLSYDFLKFLQKRINNRIVILKSFNTFIVTETKIYIMDKGPSLLATAGTGDVLSGILVGLLSQGYSRLEASILGTYLHAEAANYYMNTISKDGMTASDLIDCIPYAFNKIRQADEH